MGNGDGDMIHQITSALILPKIMKLSEYLPETDPDVLEKVLTSSFARDDARLFVSQKDGEVNGFVFATIETFEGEPAVFIQTCVILPGDDSRNLGFQLLARLRAWARESGVRYLYFMTKRKAAGFARKYNFYEYATIMKQRQDAPLEEPFEHHHSVLRRKA